MRRFLALRRQHSIVRLFVCSSGVALVTEELLWLLILIVSCFVRDPCPSFTLLCFFLLTDHGISLPQSSCLKVNGPDKLLLQFLRNDHEWRIPRVFFWCVFCGSLILSCHWGGLHTHLSVIAYRSHPFSRVTVIFWDVKRRIESI